MRPITATLVLLLVVGALAPAAWAGSGSPHIDVDDRVAQGRRLHIVVTDCVSGEGWTASITAQLRDRNSTIRRRTIPAEDDGTTQLGFRIASVAFDPGRYKAVVTCEHDFGDSGDIYFEEEERFVVERRA